MISSCCLKVNKKRRLVKITPAGSLNLMRATWVYENAEEETCNTANEKNKHGIKTRMYILSVFQTVCSSVFKIMYFTIYLTEPILKYQ